MRKIVFIITLFLFQTVLGETYDNNPSKENLYMDLSLSINHIQKDIETMKSENIILREQLDKQSEILQIQNEIIDSLSNKLKDTSNEIINIKESVGKEINDFKEIVQSDTMRIDQKVNHKSYVGLWICIGLALALGIISLIYWVILNKRKDELKTLSEKADKINEEIVNRMSSEINEMQTISKHIASISNVSGGNSDSEQALIKTLADRITFMEMTLYKMDSSVRGHRQLSRSIKQMKDNLLANGYELVDMLGKDYHEGMKVTANFIEDETLPEGKQKITGIIKPQINYRGKMIQSAQITVSQNL